MANLKRISPEYFLLVFISCFCRVSPDRLAYFFLFSRLIWQLISRVCVRAHRSRQKLIENEPRSSLSVFSDKTQGVVFIFLFLSLSYSCVIRIMQSSTNNHYLPEEFNGNFFDDQHQQDEQLFYPSDPVMDDAQDEPDDINEHHLRGAFKGTWRWRQRTCVELDSLGKESGLAGLEIKGRVRTLSPVLFYQIHTRYLIMCNNQLKNLPAGLHSREKLRSNQILLLSCRNW